MGWELIVRIESVTESFQKIFLFSKALIKFPSEPVGGNIKLLNYVHLEV
jgi:hypothetical protein